MAYALMLAGQWQELTGPTTVSGIQYPENWDWASLGAVQIVEAGDAPAGVKITGLALEDVGGVPTRVWETTPYTLDEAQTAAWASAKAFRDGKAEGGCDTPLGRVQTDPDSQRKISGACTGVLAQQAAGLTPDPIAWTMLDNEVVEHSPAQLITMGLTVMRYVNACQTAGTAVRTAIEAAADPAAVFAIDITAGYPA